MLKCIIAACVVHNRLAHNENNSRLSEASPATRLSHQQQVDSQSGPALYRVLLLQRSATVGSRS